MLIDSHAHLDYDYECSVEELLAEAKSFGVDRVIAIAASPDSLERVAALAAKFPNVYHSCGIHPHDAQFWTDELAKQVREIQKAPKCVAVGELGLDYFYHHSSREQQIQVLQEQLRLSVDIAKPIIFHSRDADTDTVACLTEHSAAWNKAGHKNPLGVIHCFTGSRELAEACLQLGYFISFSGIITFKNAEPLRQVVKDIVPLDRILVETDSPYLAPIPYRGKKNHPAYTKIVAEKVAELKGMSLEDLARHTTPNTERLFQILD